VLPDAPMKPQEDGFFRVGMSKALDELANRDLDAEFLVQFTRQALLKALTGLSFTAREFPKPAQMGVSVPLSYEEFSFTEDQAGRDFNDFHGGLRIALGAKRSEPKSAADAFINEPQPLHFDRIEEISAIK
jgi:hypothetical protein